MGNLSQQYNPKEFQIREPVYPIAGGKELDSIQASSGNPHWKSFATQLKKAHIDAAYTAAKTYVSTISSELKSTYDSLYTINQLEPLIKFDDSSKVFDERFDDIVEQLNKTWVEVIRIIEKNLDDIDRYTQSYVNQNTEYCRKTKDIFETRTDWDGCRYEEKVGEEHQCGTHGLRAYRVGVICEYCG